MGNTKQIKSKYTPVSCDLVDQIEIYATNNKPVSMIISASPKNLSIDTNLKTWYTKEKEEFVILGTNINLRMDKILTFNGIRFQLACNL